MIKQPIKIAICGFGRFAKKRILPALNITSKLKLAAIIDRDTNISQLPNNVLRFRSFDEMLNSSDIDCVYIATPNYLHASQTIESLKKGLHVICEKPMAINKNDCLKMIQTAKDKKLQLSVGHMLRYSDAINEVRNLIVSKSFGKLSFIEVIFNYDMKFTKRDWANSREYSGGGALIDAGIHCIDVIQFLLGTSIKLKNIDSFRANKKNIENEIECSFLSDDISCSIKVNSNKQYESSLILNFSNGKLNLKNFASTSGFIDIDFVSNKTSINNYLKKIDVTKTYSNQIDDFANSISSGKPNYHNAEQATEAIGIVEQIYGVAKLSLISDDSKH
ncbi:Gfo/Idh/MocA family oxidoreductase [Nitrosomonadales bacterium]|nr:Gfo/Idh/MocA family oxidoreductase [Nitrosomonadales bacterium]